MKTISCNREVRNTERILCPGAPEGPAWFHALHLGDRGRRHLCVMSIIRTRPLTIQGKPFRERCSIRDGWIIFWSSVAPMALGYGCQSSCATLVWSLSCASSKPALWRDA